MIFFYELLFVLLAIAAVVIGELWSRLAAVVFLLAWCLLATVAAASFSARLETQPLTAESDGDDGDHETRRWFEDARDGLRHLRLLFGVATLAAVGWRLIAGEH